ncbi:MAG: RNA methyltransferase [Chitinophagaceae bacterium]|nr:RNA methyltransferase [Chitinophagaceae bacterium]
MKPERKQKMDKVLSMRQADMAIVMENVGDPHNIGAVMRTADSVGIQELYIINTLITEEEFKIKRSSASAEKWITIHHFDNVKDCMMAIKKRGLTIWATHLGTSSESLYNIDLTTPVALVFGTERKGISEELLSYCDGNFIIPQVGMIQSLNISVACAVSLYEAYRQRQALGKYDGNNQLDTDLQTKTMQAWMKQYDK